MVKRKIKTSSKKCKRCKPKKHTISRRYKGRGPSKKSKASKVRKIKMFAKLGKLKKYKKIKAKKIKTHQRKGK